MNQYKIHPIVMGIKIFDKGMMTYQWDYGNTYEAYDILRKVKEMADILIPLHEPRFASMGTIKAAPKDPGFS